MAEFTDLSTEVRCIIYEYVFSGALLMYHPPFPAGKQPEERSANDGHSRRVSDAVSILFVSRNIHHEAWPVLLKHASIEITMLFIRPAHGRKITRKMRSRIRHGVLNHGHWINLRLRCAEILENGLRKMSKLKSLLISAPVGLTTHNLDIESELDDSEKYIFMSKNKVLFGRRFLESEEHVRIVRGVFRACKAR